LVEVAPLPGAEDVRGTGAQEAAVREVTGAEIAGSL
jgi:hypothetical protein